MAYDHLGKYTIKILEWIEKKNLLRETHQKTKKHKSMK